MARLLSWIKGGSGKLFDPERRALIERAASYIERQLAVRRKSFVVEEALRGVDIPAADVPHAVRQAYRLLVTRAWRNGELSTGEHKTLDWAAECLKLDHETALALQRDVGLQVFQDVFVRALDDGNVDETEHASLRRCAACLGFPLERLIREYFSAECDDLLRGLFLRCVQDGRLLADEWARLTTTAERLGLGREELLTVIQKPAERFVERVVKEVKADGRITPDEDNLLDWVLAHLVTRAEFLLRVRNEIATVRRVEPVKEGHLPNIRSTRLGLRGGEIVHAEFPAEYLRTRRLASGPIVERVPGTIVLTDHRMRFESKKVSFEVGHGRVRDIRIFPSGFELTSSGKGSGFYKPARDAESFGRMYQVAVRRARQTR